MKKTLLAIVALTMCLICTSCNSYPKESEQVNAEEADLSTADTPNQSVELSGIVNESEIVQAENGIPEQIYEFAIDGHPKYVKAFLLENGNEEGNGNALVDFYDRNGNSVKYLVGDGLWNAQGFMASFDDGNIEIGVMGMDAGPYFTEKGKEYNIRIVNER
ncbi:MAG: hypothetical protein J5605_00530 [Bacteroidales bacterium]|nr:hypothetical protein [Bacteroidales bacterium]